MQDAVHVLGLVAFTFEYWQYSMTFVKKTRSMERGGGEGNFHGTERVTNTAGLYYLIPYVHGLCFVLKKSSTGSTCIVTLTVSSTKWLRKIRISWYFKWVRKIRASWYLNKRDFASSLHRTEITN